MAKGKPPAACAQVRCPDCKTRFTPTDTHPDRCVLCTDQLVLPFPRPRDDRGRFLPTGGAR